jgi:D-ribose pyranose/furanose isomerase RbsD
MYIIEVEIRKHLFVNNKDIPSVEQIEEVLLNNIEIQEKWSMCWIKDDHRDIPITIKDLIKKYINIRGFARCANWLEHFKMKKQSTVQMKKPLRTKRPATSLYFLRDSRIP